MFQCEENYGMFVRPTQVVALDESGKPIEMDITSPPIDEGSSSSKLRSRQSR